MYSIVCHPRYVVLLLGHQLLLIIFSATKPPQQASDPPEVTTMMIPVTSVYDLPLLCVQVYVLGPKHDPSTVLSLLSDNKEIDEEELKKFKHIHTCEVGTR